MTEVPKNDGEYLKLANDLKKQFEEHKRETGRQIQLMSVRINNLVDMNTNLEHKNMRLRRMTLVMTEKYTNLCHPLQ